MLKLVRSLAAAVAVVATAGLALPVMADDNPLKSSMEAYTVELDADGREVFSKADKAIPKQVIEYRLKYANESERPLNKLAITGPIPSNTQYIADSAATMSRANLVVSIDDGENWESEPVVREVKQPNGQIERVIIPAEQYTHVRWQAASPLRGNSEQEYRYRVQIQ